ncbi:Hypothetical predicted protein, partial [Pelobates cultripes]
MFRKFWSTTIMERPTAHFQIFPKPKHRLDAARSHLCVIKVQFTEQNIRTSKA